ncbi:MAG: FAD-dependent oxidoreductase [Dethiobacteria bacterium]|nr:FAD-dependent oxidoreductase [Bacillota bacterium]
MTASWHYYLQKKGEAPEWPYTIRYGEEQEIECDVLVIGGGIAGCWAAISAARNGVKVALVEKGDIIRSGSGGPGCDHWCDCPANPISKVDPDEWAQQMMTPFGNGIGTQIQCRENYDTLLEYEQMGAKIRDDKDEYIGVEGRDEKTKFMASPRQNKNHTTNTVLRVWGTTFKPSLKKECQRLGVKVFNRVMVTSLLTEGGLQGARVVGATGFNNRTGEFMIFKAKATILCTAGNTTLYLLNTELAGYNTFGSRNNCGGGFAMAWRAGAELTLMEVTTLHNIGSGFKHTWYSGAGDASYENVQLVDANGKKLPIPTQGWVDGSMPGAGKPLMGLIRDAVKRGEYALPFYGDFPGMPELESNATWNMMLREESTSRIIVDTYNEAGFNHRKHQLMSYQLLEGVSPPQWRNARMGGLVVDWDLRTSLEGLYAAGSQMFSPRDHSFCAATGRYAGRKAAAYAREAYEPKISRDQVELEKARVYAPVKRSHGIDWKELHGGIARTMQWFCGEYLTEHLLNIGLQTLKEIEEEYVPTLYAVDPHKLMRCMEDLDILTHGRIVMLASLARKASNNILNFHRIDYPQVDQVEWNKFVTLKQENGKVITGELPLNYWGDMKNNYEANNRDYKGVYNR